MTHKDKELLIKDLCARLPYEVKVEITHWRNRDKGMIDISRFRVPLNINNASVIFNPTADVRPYLYPLSSITPEQEKELSELGVSYGEYAIHDDIRGLGIMVEDAYIFFEFCYKHHIDFLGLIPKGLALDATNLNIY